MAIFWRFLVAKKANGPGTKQIISTVHWFYLILKRLFNNFIKLVTLDWFFSKYERVDQINTREKTDLTIPSLISDEALFNCSAITDSPSLCVEYFHCCLVIMILLIQDLFYLRWILHRLCWWDKKQKGYNKPKHNNGKCFQYTTLVLNHEKI